MGWIVGTDGRTTNKSGLATQGQGLQHAVRPRKRAVDGSGIVLAECGHEVWEWEQTPWERRDHAFPICSECDRFVRENPDPDLA